MPTAHKKAINHALLNTGKKHCNIKKIGFKANKKLTNNTQLLLAYENIHRIRCPLKSDVTSLFKQ